RRLLRSPVRAPRLRDGHAHRDREPRSHPRGRHGRDQGRGPARPRAPGARRRAVAAACLTAGAPRPSAAPNPAVTRRSPTVEPRRSRERGLPFPRETPVSNPGHSPGRGCRRCRPWLALGSLNAGQGSFRARPQLAALRRPRRPRWGLSRPVPSRPGLDPAAAGPQGRWPGTARGLADHPPAGPPVRRMAQPSRARRSAGRRSGVPSPVGPADRRLISSPIGAKFPLTRENCPCPQGHVGAGARRCRHARPTCARTRPTTPIGPHGTIQPFVRDRVTPQSTPATEEPMILRVDRLQIELPMPSEPDPAAAASVQELLGRRFGEMSTLMNYTYQSFNMRGRDKVRPFYDLVANIAAEEYGHIELVSAVINGLLTGTPTSDDPLQTPFKRVKDTAGLRHHWIYAGLGALPVNSLGKGWSGEYVFNSGDLVLDLLHNFFLECGARMAKIRVY